MFVFKYFPGLEYICLKFKYFQVLSRSVGTLHNKVSKYYLVFLSRFGAFLKSEIKFSKLLVQPPHYLVHIIKAVSHSFEQVAMALVHSCN